MCTSISPLPFRSISTLKAHEQLPFPFVHSHATQTLRHRRNFLIARACTSSRLIIDGFRIVRKAEEMKDRKIS